MPRYSSKEVLRQKLKYAIHFCKSIDTDDYARIALTAYTGTIDGPAGAGGGGHVFGGGESTDDQSDISDNASNSEGEIMTSDE